MGNEQSSVNPKPSGRIKVTITAPEDSCETRANVKGYRTHAITDEERKLFRITPNKLKAAVEDYFGKEPTDAFLTSPTKYGDMYAMYEHFDVVLTTVTPVDAKIIDEPRRYDIIVATKRFVNTCDERSAFEVAFSETETNTISSSWSQELESNLEVDYKIKLPITPKISLRNKFGSDFKSSKTVTISSESRVSTYLNPGKSVDVNLKSIKNTVFVKVIYEITLEGHVACNYEGGYKGHTFWAFDVNDVLEAAEKPTVIKTSEILKLVYYTNGVVELCNVNTHCSRRRVRHYYLEDSD